MHVRAPDRVVGRGPRGAVVARVEERVIYLPALEQRRGDGPRFAACVRAGNEQATLRSDEQKDHWCHPR